MCVSAGGKAAPPVFVQADSRLKKGEFDATKVPGLGVGLGADDDNWEIARLTVALKSAQVGA